MALIEIQEVVDARRRSSAELIAMVAGAMESTGSGGFVEAISTDPASVVDVAAWCGRTGHVIVDQSGDGATYSFVIGRRRWVAGQGRTDPSPGGP
jgi:TusA-related sulfurtransferase